MNKVGIREARDKGAALGLSVSASLGTILWALTTPENYYAQLPFKDLKNKR